MSFGSSSNLPSASVLTGKTVVYIEPITKVGEEVRPYFRKKEKAPEGSARAWSVINDHSVDYVEGYLVQTGIELRDPHPDSGVKGQIPYINLYILDSEDSNLVYILESKMTSLGRDIINTVLGFTEFEKTLRIRLYRYSGSDRMRAGVSMETDLDNKEPTAIEWKFDKTGYLKAETHLIGQRTIYDFAKVDSFLLNEFEDYARLLKGEAVASEALCANQKSQDVGTATLNKEASAAPQDLDRAFNPAPPASRKEIIEYGLKVGIFDTEEEVRAFVDSIYGQVDGDGDEKTRKRAFWNVLNKNLPEALDETSDCDALRVMAYFARSPLYNVEPVHVAIHMVAKNFKDLLSKQPRGTKISQAIRKFIREQNALMA